MRLNATDITIQLASNSYRKSGVRLLRVTRTGQQHEIKDVSVHIQLQGEFEVAHTKGDNSAVLPTDTTKNTVYALAAEEPVQEIEHFAARLVWHFLKNNGQVSSVSVAIEELHGDGSRLMASRIRQRLSQGVGSYVLAG